MNEIRKMKKIHNSNIPSRITETFLKQMFEIYWLPTQVQLPDVWTNQKFQIGM